MAKDSRGLVFFLVVAVAICIAALTTSARAAVGRTTGSFNVSSSGAATYSIPIFTPPGPHGVQPNISLVYNSNSNVGYMGRGWSLSGLSSIKRCSKTLAQDGSNNAMAFSSLDAYCLDGNRLRLQSGSYGATSSVYATEMADFSRTTITSYTGWVSPGSWTVERKDGLIYTYDAQASVPFSLYGAVIEWMPSEIRDRVGNKVKLTWSSGGQGTLHPSKIEWTQTSVGSGTYVYSMDFSYSPNTLASERAGYAGGQQFYDSDLLTDITVSVSGTVKRNYVLTYNNSPSTGAKRLTQVKECSDGGATDCLSPTNITYQDGASGVNTGSSVFISGNITAVDGTHDFNGDGIKDIAYMESGIWYVRMGTKSSGYDPAINTGLSTFLPGKLLGTAADQVLAPSSSGPTWDVYALSGGTFVATPTGISTTYQPVVADINGDGLDDLVDIGPGPSLPFFPGTYFPSIMASVYRNTSSGGLPSFAAPVSSTLFMFSDPGYAVLPSYPNPPFNAWVGGLSTSKGDVTGSGQQGIGLAITVYYCDGIYGCGSFDDARVATFDSSLNVQNTIVADQSGSTVMINNIGDDLNNDGCDDYVVPAGVAMSDCAGAVSASGVFTYYYQGDMDWDGDGRRDFINFNTSTFFSDLLPTYGIGFGSAIPTGVFCPAGSISHTDGDGDGLDDLVCLGYGSYLSIYYHNGVNVVPDLATSFADGYGVTYAPDYTAIERSNYSPYTGTAWPYRDVAGNRRVVRSVTAPDGIGGTYSTIYNYFGAVTNLQGRGFSGFDKIESVDSRNSIKHVQSFAHEFPNTGMLVGDSFYQPGGALISSRTVTPATLAAATLDPTSGNQRYFPYPTSSAEDLYEVGGAKDTLQIAHTDVSNTFDGSGNLTATTKTVTDKDATSPLYNYAWVQATSRTISPNTTYWCLGLPFATSVAYSTTTGETTVTQGKSFTPDYVHCRVDADSVGSSNLEVDTTYGYDSFGNVNSTSVTGRNPNGSSMATRTATTGWGTTGQFPVSETNALSQTTTRSFDSTFGQLATETDPNGILVASNTYDSFGRFARARHADGTSTVYTYYDCAANGWCMNGDPLSGVTSIHKLHLHIQELDLADALIHDTWNAFDQFDRQIVKQSVLDTGTYNRVGRQYDALGRIYRETAPCATSSCSVYWTTNAYDLLGRITQQTRPLSDSNSTPVTTTYAYTGDTQSVTDADGKVTTKIKDANGWMRRSIDNDGYTQGFGYDAAGNLKLVNDSLSNTLFTASYNYGVKPFRVSTNDMDLGNWTYSYDSLGELVSWTDAKSQSFSQTYDALSRVTSKVEPSPDGTTSWVWDTNTDVGCTSGDIGQLVGMYKGDFGETYCYDSIGRLKMRTTAIASIPYYTDFTYNGQGLLDTLTYPTSTSSTRVKVKYGYAYGILQNVTDWTSGSAGTVYWTADAQNPRGQTTQEALGNGVVTQRNFDAVTGWLNSIHSDVGVGTGLQNLSYGYDNVGNVALRQDSSPANLTENFYYDNLHRLDHSTLNKGSGATTNLQMHYDAMGNITHRSDVNGDATWTYDGTRKHAVASTGSGGVTYSYDANGNMTNRSGYTIGWTSYNYPSSLASAGESTAFYYGPDRQYYRQDYTGPSTYETTYYIGGLLEKVCSSASCASGTIDWRHNIIANGQTVAIVSRKSSGTNAVHYALDDNQGSGSTLTDSSGSLLVRESFGAFGLPRDGSDWDGAVPSGDLTTIEGISRRGYTGHSMLGRMGLIHMNGRVQDAITGRFLSPDPTIPDPGFTQSFNRYSYVNDNPLSFVDPSGFCSDKPGDYAYCEVLDELQVRGECDIWCWIERMHYSLCIHLGCNGSGLNDDGSPAQSYLQSFTPLTSYVAPTAPATPASPPKATPVSSPQSQAPHHYEVDVPLGLCINPREGFEVMRNFSAPGGVHAQDGRHDVELWGGNWITQTVDPAAMTIKNVAIPGKHVFGGYVNISMYQRNGVTGVHIEGGGVGPNAKENQFWGPKIFEALGEAAAMGIPCNGVGAAL